MTRLGRVALTPPRCRCRCGRKSTCDPTRRRRISASRALDAGRALPLVRLLVYIPDLASTRLGNVGLDFLGGTAVSPTALGLKTLTVSSDSPLMLPIELCVLCMFLAPYGLKWVVMHLMTPPYLVSNLSLTSNTPPSLP
jgi:hypothetical protein